MESVKRNRKGRIFNKDKKGINKERKTSKTKKIEESRK